jgi:hypothetical protein
MNIPDVLDQVYRESMFSEERFEHKRVLFIPSESYCAATITIIQGLEELGFEICVPFRPNINSWFCNKVVASQDLAGVKADFIISNLHWGTRWDYYRRFGLMDRVKVLIDGDDSRHGLDWKARYDGWCSVYRDRPSDGICALRQQPYRWMEPLGEYEPDIVFSSQKAPSDTESIYLPFGMRREYMALRQYGHREIDFANVPGDGPKRIELTRFLAVNRGRMPGELHNTGVKGIWSTFGGDDIFESCKTDPNVHSWARWRMYNAYIRLLNDTRCLIYPGVFDFPQWHSKREFEALALGCLVMMARPTIDMSSYPMTELCEFAVYDSLDEMVDKCNWLHGHNKEFEEYGAFAYVYAETYFSPITLARRFLRYVREAM